MNEHSIVTPSIAAAWANNRRHLHASGRFLDEEFFRRGFSSVKALVDFKSQVYGPGTYEAFLEAQSSPEAFERFRALDAEAMERIKAARNGSNEARVHACDLILKDRCLTDHTKDTALAILCESRHNDLFREYVPLVKRAQRLEKDTLCTIYKEDIPLLSKNTVPLRKDVYNAVMEDAFGALGFESLRPVKGLSKFTKRLTSSLAITIEADRISMERDYSPAELSELRYWPIVGFDGVSYLGSAKRQEKQRYITFLPVMNCVAASQFIGYDDTRSLEVMIRGRALWYELTIKSFEQSVVELG